MSDDPGWPSWPQQRPEPGLPEPGLPGTGTNETGFPETGFPETRINGTGFPGTGSNGTGSNGTGSDGTGTHQMGDETAAGPSGANFGWQNRDFLPASSVHVARKQRGGRATRLNVAIFAAIAFIGAGTGASLIVARTSAGATTPAGAVDEMFTALDNSDVIGVLDSLAPGERNAIEPGLEDIFGQLKRLGILSSDADLHRITGLSDQFQGFTTSTDQLTPNVAAVSVAGGTETSSVDPGQLPLATYFKSLIEVAMNGKSRTSTSPASSGSTEVGTIRVDDKWYVSIGYSVAINAVRGDGESGAPPAANEALQARGAPTPQGAVQDLFNSISDLDLESLIADLPPDEMSAVDAYAPDWLDQAQSELNAVKDKVSIHFSNLTYTTKPVDGGTLVQVGDGITVNVSADGVHFRYANGCYAVTYKGRTEHGCENVAQEQDQLLKLLPPAVQPIYQRLISGSSGTGFVTVDEDGSWFLSPTRTYLQAVSAFLSKFEPSDVQTVIANARGIGAAVEKLLQEQERAATPSLSSDGPGMLLPPL